MLSNEQIMMACGRCLQIRALITDHVGEGVPGKAVPQFSGSGLRERTRGALHWMMNVFPAKLSLSISSLTAPSFLVSAWQRARPPYSLSSTEPNGMELCRTTWGFSALEPPWCHCSVALSLTQQVAAALGTLREHLRGACFLRTLSQVPI